MEFEGAAGGRGAEEVEEVGEGGGEGVWGGEPGGGCGEGGLVRVSLVKKVREGHWKAACLQWARGEGRGLPSMGVRSDRGNILRSAMGCGDQQAR